MVFPVSREGGAAKVMPGVMAADMGGGTHMGEIPSRVKVTGSVTDWTGWMKGRES